VFDGDNLLIKVNQGVTTLDIQTDLYSDWKEWVQTGNNSKFLPALRTIGGDPTVETKVVAPYFFLMNGWKIKPYSWNHTLNLIGNLFVDNPQTYGSNVIVPPDGYFTVLVNMSTTSDASKLLVGSGVTQQDKEDIANLVETQTGQPIKTETDKIPNIKIQTDKLAELQGQVTNIELHNIGHIKLVGDILTIYDTSEEVIARYKLIKDNKGKVVERVPLS
jgi:hypothetical protein